MRTRSASLAGGPSAPAATRAPRNRKAWGGGGGGRGLSYAQNMTKYSKDFTLFIFFKKMSSTWSGTRRPPPGGRPGETTAGPASPAAEPTLEEANHTYVETSCPVKEFFQIMFTADGLSLDGSGHRRPPLKRRRGERSRRQCRWSRCRCWRRCRGRCHPHDDHLALVEPLVADAFLRRRGGVLNAVVELPDAAD